MKQKGLAPILIVLLIALGVGGYLIYQKQNTTVLLPQQTTQPISTPSSTVDTTNWKTYENTNGYSLNYPPTIELIKPSEFIKDSDIDKVKKLILRLKNSSRTGFFNPSMIIQVIDQTKEENKVTVLKPNCKSYNGNIKFNNLAELSQLVYKNETNVNCSYFDSIISDLKKDKFLNAYDAYKFIVKSQQITGIDGGFLVPKGNMTYVLFSIGDKYYLISYDATEPSFDQILSTFRFD